METLDANKRNELLEEIITSKYNDSTNWSYVKYLSGKLIIHFAKGTGLKLKAFWEFLKEKYENYK